MRWLSAALLGSALVLHQALAEFTFKASATKNGVPIPDSEIKFVPYQFGRSPPGKGAPPGNPKHRMTRRANAQVSSANWCGSVNTTPSTNKIKYIEAYWQHPTCTKRTGQIYPQAVAAWTGIDGDTATTSILQAGTVCKFDNATASVRNEAWWQWFPSASYSIAPSTLPVNAGDWFNLKINMTSDTAGIVVFTNASKGIAVTLNLSGGSALSRTDSVWVVERPQYGSSLAGFAAFTDIWFQDASAARTSGANLQIVGSKQYYIPGLCASSEYSSTYMVAWNP